MADFDAHFESGWGLPERPDDDDLEACRLTIPPSAAQITRHLSALEWPATYLVAHGHSGSAQMLGLWATCKAYRRPFDRACEARSIGRSAAYALRDRGLSLISQGLARELVMPSPGQ
ncbi:hypothetical protein GCM10007315_03810 [Gemmobacter tilapiae]|uniref:Uncharacterized protein n=2 Tax=Neogemmobacter tilapiae TaxID=875041 RepID=A0A918TGC8_9RHOB|nr:hypothetical protein GCM10007315_03810 [Gemmobacter tilapiae]